MHSSSSEDLSELTTERLCLRTWTASEVRAVRHSEGSVRRADWAEDFPSEGDSVIAGLLGDTPARLGSFGHRLIIERDAGIVVGSIGLFWPPSEGALELGYGVVASPRPASTP